MTKKLTKLNISLIIIAFSAMLFSCLFASNAFISKKQTATAYEAGSSTTLMVDWCGTFNYQYYGDVKNLLITNIYTVPETYFKSYDVSEAQDGSLTAYLIANDDSTYDCVIHGNVETIYAPMNLSNAFAGVNSSTCLANLETITFDKCFNTSNTKIFTNNFREMTKLKYLDLSGWNTENATDMKYMFWSCSNIEYLNLDNFVIKNGVDKTGFSISCPKLTTLVAPKICETNIPMYCTMADTNMVYDHLSCATNGKTLTNQTVLDTETLVAKSAIYNITSLLVTTDLNDKPSIYQLAIDVSSNGDEKIIAYIVDNGNETQKCIIYSDDEIYAPTNCNGLFAIKSLVDVNLKDLNTKYAVNLNSLFVKTGHTITLKGLLALDYKDIDAYTEGMTWTEFIEYVLPSIEELSPKESKWVYIAFLEMMHDDDDDDVEGNNGPVSWTIVSSGEYDVTMEYACLSAGYTYDPSMTWKDVYEGLYGTSFSGTEEECVQYLESQYGLKLERKTYDMTLKALSVIYEMTDIYVDDMTFKEFVTASGVDTSNMTEEECQLALEQETGFKLARTGIYDIAMNDACELFNINYVDGMTFIEFCQYAFGETFTGTEIECKQALEQAFGLKFAYFSYTGEHSDLKELNITNLDVNSNLISTNMLFGANALETIYAPAQCNSDIVLPSVMYKQGTASEFKTLSSLTNSSVLVSTANLSAPATGFVDEQLLPAMTIGFVSLLFVVYFAMQNKKRKNINCK